MTVARTWQAAATEHTALSFAPGVALVPRLALYGFILSIPFEIPHRSIPVDVPTVTAAVFLAATLLSPSASYRRLPAAVKWFVLYLWVFLAVTLAHPVVQQGQALRLFIWLAQLVLLLWTLGNVLADPRVMRGSLNALVAGCVAWSGLQVLGIGTTAHAVYTGGERVTLFGQNANLSAMILAVGLVALVGRAVGAHDRGWQRRLLTWPGALLLGVAILQTGSRGGLASAVVGLAVLAVRGGTLARRVLHGLIAAAALVGLGWGASRTEVMRNRLVQAEEGHLAGREQIYPVAVRMWLERPIAGWGPIDNQFELAHRLAEPGHDRRDMHNLVLELVTATGVLGAMPFLAGLGACVGGAVRARHGALGVLPLALVLTVLAGTITGTWIASKILWLCLAVGLGAGMHWRRGVPCAV